MKIPFLYDILFMEMILMNEEQIPELNIFMICNQLNKKAISNISDEFIIRKCIPEELDIWKGFPFDNENEKKEYYNYMTDYFNEVYNNNIEEFYNRCLFVCDKDNNPIATCFLWKSYENINTIHWLKTKKEYEGKGLGRALMSLIMKDLKEEDYPIYLHTHPSCYRAIGLYSSLGFKVIVNDEIGNRKNDYEESKKYLGYFMTPETYSSLEYVEVDDPFKIKEKNIKLNHF